ncbi:hypothetical protein B1748_35340 [Paenibacillus sp. MY03]|uniref:sialate O-acetylesterase n=1 Tax=Paenibacillus sp. MY03 TaxID=302980 RepID=UPI000B3BF588|nr:sialate O-acetylesterase [Paenibacillus sp. MY03]OUS67914.1 hypothetical protein B1748_35340 [Paenibacillus sp. MY03]
MTTTTSSDYTLTLKQPKPYQVIQRYGYDPMKSYANHPGGPLSGQGTVIISGNISCSLEMAQLEARTVLMQDAYGEAVDWMKMEVEWRASTFQTTLKVPAGGWYRLELRLTDKSGDIMIESSVEPIGVGEVFVIAGQSYAENCNDEYLQIQDPEGRISCYDSIAGDWRIAHDPQPGVRIRDIHDTRLKGTIWPAAMNHLLPLLRVPIGMVNVAVSSTASRQWMPGERLYRQLLHAGKSVGDFRALLWQQGESDVIEATPTDVYISRLIAIKTELERQWEHSFLWMPAKSTLHPEVYSKPLEEGWIREAIHELWDTAGFAPGPDTDILGGIGIHRAVTANSQHFTLLGQQQAGMLWCISIWNMLQRI